MQARDARTRRASRLVYAYIVFGEKIGLIDCGVAGSSGLLFDSIRQAGRDPRDIAMVLL